MFGSSPSHLSMNPRLCSIYRNQTVCTCGWREKTQPVGGAGSHKLTHTNAPNWCSPNKAAKAPVEEGWPFHKYYWRNYTSIGKEKGTLMNPILIKTISKWIMNLNVFVMLF